MAMGQKRVLDLKRMACERSTSAQQHRRSRRPCPHDGSRTRAPAATASGTRHTKNSTLNRTYRENMRGQTLVFVEQKVLQEVGGRVAVKAFRRQQACTTKQKQSDSRAKAK